jgi:recombination protein RecT
MAPQNPALSGNKGGSIQVPSTFEGSKLEQIVQVFDLYALKAGQFSRHDMDIVTVFKQFALVVFQSEALKKCTTASLMGFAYTCAANGFSPLPQDKECYAVPYKRKWKDANGNWKEVLECQFQNGYGGIVKKIMRSGYVSYVDAYAVYEGDPFEVQYGTEAKIMHKPGPNEGDASKCIGAYAIAKMKDGNVKFKWLPKVRVERLRLKSPAQKDGELGGMWKDDYDSAAVIKAIKILGDQMSKEVRSHLRDDGSIIRIEQDSVAPIITYPDAQEGSAEVMSDDEMRAAELQAQLNREAGTTKP